MTTPANEKSRRVLAATTNGLVDEELPPGGVAVQPLEPPPDGTLIVVATAGDQGTAHCETAGAAIVGDGGLATVKRYGVAYAGKGGCASSGAADGLGGGAEVTASVLDDGTARSEGDGGIAIARLRGEAVVGGQGIAIAFLDGVASAQLDSVIIIGYREGPKVHFKVGVIGEKGLLPGVRYMLDENRDFTEAPLGTNRVACVWDCRCPEIFQPPTTLPANPACRETNLS